MKTPVPDSTEFWRHWLKLAAARKIVKFMVIIEGGAWAWNLFRDVKPADQNTLALGAFAVWDAMGRLKHQPAYPPGWGDGLPNARHEGVTVMNAMCSEGVPEIVALVDLMIKSGDGIRDLDEMMKRCEKK